MSDATFNKLLGIGGGVLLALAHSGLIPPMWAQFVGEIGTLVVGQALLARRGDTPIADLPKYIQDSVRPSKAP